MPQNKPDLPIMVDDPIIHVNTSTSESPMVCNAAIVGGEMGDNVWLIVMAFTGSRMAWLSDERWHRLNACPTNTGKVTT